MEAYVDTLCVLAQPELTENQTAKKSDTKEIKKKHTSRLVGGVETGSQGREDSRCCGRTETGLATETGGVWEERGRQSDP